jgi:hypothetical protein
MTFKKISMAILCSVILQPHLVAQFPPEFQVCPNGPGPPSRFSYFSSYVTASGQQRSRGIRFELYPNGIYLITRSRNGANKTLWGTLNIDQLGMFAVLANRLDFGGGQGVYRSGQGLEYFEAEVWIQQKTYLWVNPEHLRPFPNSVVNIINWLDT